MKSSVARVLALIALPALVAAGLYFYGRQAEEPPPLPEPKMVAPKQPEIRYPLPAPTPQAESRTPLPALVDSEAAATQAARQLVGKDALERLFFTDLLVRRVVVTLDNLPRRRLPRLYALAKPVDGRLVVDGKDYSVTLKPENYRRYAPYVTLFESLDTERLVALYTHFYPLLQEEYRNSENPRQYFNDRVVEVIDHLLAAPEIHYPIALVHPKVLYEFADPKLEALSAGQKIMIRIGPDNAVRVKEKLRQIRRALTGVP